ncbi:unnamed protein product [Gadus morhua 'NCC']
MGVKCLRSLLEDYSQIYRDIHFRDSKLLVDGTNLAHHLYRRANLDQNHGGEYLAFQTKVQAFFKTLEYCRIKAYVVLDGGSGGRDSKRDTRMGAIKTLLQKFPNALIGKKVGIYPRFITTVFEQTLSNNKVDRVRCFGKADGQLAALAREWCCPVLSGDTDFYIYDLLAGVLPLDHFQWDSEETSQGRTDIPCKLYTTSSFCNAFKIHRQLLPLFASLANDNIKLQRINWHRFLPADRNRKSKKAAYLEDLLSWLQARADQTTEDILRALMAFLDMSQQAQTEVQTAILEYRLPSSSLRGFFTEGAAPSLPAEMLSWVPVWVRASLARGDLGANILDCDVLLNRRKILRIQVEHSDLQSSNLTSRPIRQVMYGLLLGQRGGEVVEWDRDGLKLDRVEVRPLVQGAAQRLRLDSLPQVDAAVRLQVCLETLGVEEKTLEGVPADLRLPVAVTCYWLRWASPEPTLLKALLMVMVQGELNRRTGGTTGGHHDTKHTTQQLPDRVMAHSFNQWQACLYDASQLNLLLCKPLPEPHYAWLYQGRLVHWRQKQLQEREPEVIVQGDQFRTLYMRLLGVVIQPDPWANRRAGGPEAQLRASMEHLHLNTQDDEEEELGGAAGLDQGSDRPRVTVRTRYRTKDRKDRSRNPELWRKQEREGWFFNQCQACLKDASQLNLLFCKPLPEPHYAGLYQGRLVHRRQKQLQEREPEEILHDPRFRRLYRRLLEAVNQSDPGAKRRAGGPEAQLGARMEHLHLNTQDEEEEEEDLGGAAGLDQGSDGPWVEVKSRRRKQ